MLLAFPTTGNSIEMLPRWSRVLSRIGSLQRNTELVRRDFAVFSLRNYATVAPAVEPNVKFETSKPEVWET